MTQDLFVSICSSFNVDPAIALENDEVCDLLAGDSLDPSAENQSRLSEILRQDF